MKPALNKSAGKKTRIPIVVAILAVLVVALAFWKTNLWHHIASAASRINAVMPLLSTLVLVLLSIFIALPGIFPSFETTIKKFRWSLAFLCIVIGVWGFAVDVHQHGEADELNKKLLKDAEETLKKTYEIASDVSKALEALRTLPTKAQIDAEIDAKEKQLRDPKNANNAALVASIKSDIAVLQKTRQDADYQRNIANLPIIVGQLKYWKEPFLEIKTDVEARKNDSPYTYHGQQLIEKDKEQDDRLDRARADSLESLRKIATSAEALRELMWNRLSKDRVRDSDDHWRQEFMGAMTNPSENFDGIAAAAYLEDLKTRADASQ